MAKKSAVELIERALAKAKGPLSIDQICEAAFGRRGERERNLVRVNLHRLDERGMLIKHPLTYELKR